MSQEGQMFQPDPKTKRRRRLGNLIPILVMTGWLLLLCLYALPYFKTYVDSSEIVYMMYLGYFLIVMYASFLLSVVLHEAGHLIFGLLAGYRFCSFRIFSWMFIEENGKIRLKKLSLKGTAGQCLMEPPQPPIQNPRRRRQAVCLYNMGGVLMNLICALVFGLLWLVGARYSLFGCFLFLMMLSNLLTACTNGFPIQNKLICNDGQNMVFVLKNPGSIDAFDMQMETATAFSKGKSSQDMPDSWFTEAAIEDVSNSITGYCASLYASRLVNGKAFEEAVNYLETIGAKETGMIGLQINGLMLEYLFALIMTGQNQKAEEILDQKPWKNIFKGLPRDPSACRFAYARAVLLEHDEKKAGKARKLFERFAKSYPYAGELKCEKELMELIDERAVQICQKPEPICLSQSEQVSSAESADEG